MNLEARLPAYLAAKLAGVSKQTFNYWRTSGKVEPDENGEYRLGDVLAVERATRNNPNSRRGVSRGRAAWAAVNRKPPAPSFAA